MITVCDIITLTFCLYKTNRQIASASPVMLYFSYNFSADLTGPKLFFPKPSSLATPRSRTRFLRWPYYTHMPAPIPHTRSVCKTPNHTRSHSCQDPHALLSHGPFNLDSIRVESRLARSHLGLVKSGLQPCWRCGFDPHVFGLRAC